MSQRVSFNLFFEADDAQEINIQNMNVELVAQMFKNYQSNVLFHLEGNAINIILTFTEAYSDVSKATDSLKDPS
jgi:hypothetical protein